MNRKDVELIARTIKRLNFVAEQKKFIAQWFADDIGAANANFDRAKFLKACGVTL